MAVPSKPVTSISVGLLVRDMLVSDERVSAMATKIYPVVAEANAGLPYVCYRRANFDRQLAKGPGQGADTIAVEILCYAKTYAESIDLAEAVRACLDHQSAVYDNGEGHSLAARSIDLEGSEEGWADDAYAQSLVFTVRVNNV